MSEVTQLSFGWTTVLQVMAFYIYFLNKYVIREPLITPAPVQQYLQPGPEVEASMKDTSPRPLVFLGHTYRRYLVE